MKHTFGCGFVAFAIHRHLESDEVYEEKSAMK